MSSPNFYLLSSPNFSPPPPKLSFNEIDLLMEQDELTKMYGPDAISDLIARNPNSGCSESNDNEERIPSGDDSPLHAIRIT